MSLSVFYVLVSVTSILFYIILYLWWTPQKLRLTMVGAMLVAFAAFLLLTRLVNRQLIDQLSQSYFLLYGRAQSLIGDLIGDLVLFAALVTPLLIPKMRAALTPENGVTLPLALGLGVSIGHLVPTIWFALNPEVSGLISEMPPEWIALLALFSPVQSTARYALAVSFLLIAWPDPGKCVYAAIAGITVLAIMTGSKFLQIVWWVTNWEFSSEDLPRYAALVRIETFSMLGLTILALWMVDRMLRRRKIKGNFQQHSDVVTSF